MEIVKATYSAKTKGGGGAKVETENGNDRLQEHV